MRILMPGVGVIGSVYAGHLRDAGHEVTLMARGRRLAELQTSGLASAPPFACRCWPQLTTSNGILM